MAKRTTTDDDSDTNGAEASALAPGKVDAGKRMSPMERLAEGDEARFARISNELGDGGLVTLERRPEGRMDYSWIGEIGAKGFSPALVAQVYGGGDYRATAKTIKGALFFDTIRFSIDASIPAKHPLAKGAEAPTTPGTHDPAALVNAVAQAVRAQLPAAPAGPDPMVLQMMQNQHAMMMALLTRDAAPKTDPAILALLTKMAERNEGGGVLQEIKKLQAIQEFTGMGSGGGNDDAKPAETDWKLEIFRALGPTVAPMLVNLLANQAGGGAAMPPSTVAEIGGIAGQPALPAPAAQILPPNPAAAAAPTAIPTANPSASPADPMLNPLLAAFIPQFRKVALAAAAKHRDPFEWVSTKMDEIGPMMQGPIFALARADDWFKKIFGNDPAAAESIEWLAQMRNHVLAFWVVYDVTEKFSKTPTLDPAAYATDLVQRAPESFHDYLFSMTGEEAWAEMFNDSKLPASTIMAVRIAVDKELDGDEIEVTATDASQPAATTPESFAVAEVKPPGKKKK